MDTKLVQQFLHDIHQENYVEADKKFPNIVKSALDSIINNRKPAILKQLNGKAEQIAAESVQLKKESPIEDKK